jgi:hypothetical protein
MLSNQAIRLASAQGKIIERGNHYEITHGLPDQAIGQASEFLTYGKLVNHHGETHRLFDQAIGLVSAFRIGRKRELHRGDSLAGGLGHPAGISTGQGYQAGEPS